MEEKTLKKDNKFIDNIAYKSRFQFLIWANDNVICQRYFKINGYNENAIYSKEFDDCMNGIVDSIQKDLESKSRVFLWYTNSKEPMKLQGFLSDSDVEKYGDEFLGKIVNKDITGNVIAPDGKVIYKEYMTYDESMMTDFGDNERPVDGDVVFKFSFLVDDKPVFEKIWDGNVYPKFVRNGVDLTNVYGSIANRETFNFGSYVLYHMQRDKTNLIIDFIYRICDVLSNFYNKKNDYVREFSIGDKKYDYYSAYESYKRSWEEKVRSKTSDYYRSIYPSEWEVERIERKYK